MPSAECTAESISQEGELSRHFIVRYCRMHTAECTAECTADSQGILQETFYSKCVRCTAEMLTRECLLKCTAEEYLTRECLLKCTAECVTIECLLQNACIIASYPNTVVVVVVVSLPTQVYCRMPYYSMSTVECLPIECLHKYARLLCSVVNW